MRVDFERTPTFDDIFADPDFGEIRKRFQTERLVRQFVPNVIRIFWGGLRTPDSLTRYADHWGRTHSTSDPEMPAVLGETAALLTRLYMTWDARLAHLRGALVEGLVLSQLEPRYSQNRLVDNARVMVRNGINFTSPTTVDVSGWDGNRGEFHDCKARSKRVDLDLVRALEANLRLPEFRIGVVTVDSRPVMVATLREAGYAPAVQTTLIPLEELWDLAPLHRPQS